VAVFPSVTSASDVWSLTDIKEAIHGSNWPQALITSGLIVNLDASNSASYPGSGTVWYDLSGNNNNFNILSTAYNSSGVKYMDFNGSYGIAKNAADISFSGNVTYMVWTRIKSSTSEWRTLTRGYGGDHNVIIESGGYGIGFYDNDGAAFLNSTYSQQSLPSYGTSNWICLFIRFSTSSPYWTLSYNDTPETIRGSIANSNAQHTRGIGAIGGYHNGDATPSNASQYWGDIASFYVYNRVLTNAELLQNYNATRNRFSV
jgi:hypothetical protein